MKHSGTVGKLRRLSLTLLVVLPRCRSPPVAASRRQARRAPRRPHRPQARRVPRRPHRPRSRRVPRFRPRPCQPCATGLRRSCAPRCPACSSRAPEASAARARLGRRHTDDTPLAAAGRLPLVAPGLRPRAGPRSGAGLGHPARAGPGPPRSPRSGRQGPLARAARRRLSRRGVLLADGSILCNSANEKRLPVTTLVWTDGDGEWQPVHTVGRLLREAEEKASTAPSRSPGARESSSRPGHGAGSSCRPPGERERSRRPAGRSHQRGGSPGHRLRAAAAS